MNIEYPLSSNCYSPTLQHLHGVIPSHTPIGRSASHEDDLGLILSDFRRRHCFEVRCQVHVALFYCCSSRELRWRVKRVSMRYGKCEMLVTIIYNYNAAIGRCDKREKTAYLLTGTGRHLQGRHLDSTCCIMGGGEGFRDGGQEG